MYGVIFIESHTFTGQGAEEARGEGWPAFSPNAGE